VNLQIIAGRPGLIGRLSAGCHNAQVDFDWSDQNSVVHPEWEGGPDAPSQSTKAARISWITSAAVATLLVLVGGLFVAGRSATEDLAAPDRTEAALDVTSTTTSTILTVSGARVVAEFDAPVLGVEVDAISISTDFDGVLFALDLDSGILTRSRIRTGSFVTIDGQLAIQTGCGGWRAVELPGMTEGADLIGCGSYQPFGQLGAEALFFTRPDSGGLEEVLVYDGEDGLLPVVLAQSVSSEVLTVADGRVLFAGANDEIIWIDPATGESSVYATGRLLAAQPGGVLWTTSCEPSQRCEVWFGTPDDAKVHRFVVDRFDRDMPVRLNRDGTRAVFFKEDDVLRIVTTETGHARELKNPGIDWSGATWSPDGLWLLEPDGASVSAVNTLNGRFRQFEGVPGDVSPGWLAMIENP
jgi:hypothetical protein